MEAHDPGAERNEKRRKVEVSERNFPDWIFSPFFLFPAAVEALFCRKKWNLMLPLTESATLTVIEFPDIISVVLSGIVDWKRSFNGIHLRFQFRRNFFLLGFVVEIEGRMKMYDASRGMTNDS